jgi:hypothetical protein
MAALTTQQEYDAIRLAIQQLTTLDSNGERRDIVSTTIAGFSVSYSSSQLPQLQEREIILANRLAIRNIRKRVTPDFAGGSV